MKPIPEKTIERLILYRRFLMNVKVEEKANIFSHELSTMTGFSSAQIRRDLMEIGYSGSPIKGYDTKNLIDSISEFIDAPEKQHVAIIGLGQLGRAIVNYFKGRRQKLEIIAAFDKDPNKAGKVVNGCRCYHIDELEKVIKENEIRIVILAIPEVGSQEMAERLVNAGIRGILNYAPTKLYLPHNIYIENRDMIMAVEKVAYFARQINQEGFFDALS